MSGLSQKSSRSAIVIGGGFGGIAAAIRLRGLGFHVTLLDRLARLGGKAQVYVREGFRYDAGPTMITKWLWAISNLGWITFDLWIGAYSQAFLFAVYFGMCVWGIIAWSKEAQQTQTNKA